MKKKVSKLYLAMTSPHRFFARIDPRIAKSVASPHKCLAMHTFALVSGNCSRAKSAISPLTRSKPFLPSLINCSQGSFKNLIPKNEIGRNCIFMKKMKFKHPKIKSARI